MLFLHYLVLVIQRAAAASTGEVVVGGTMPLNAPMGVSWAPNGQLLVVDTDNHRILQCPSWTQGFTQQPCSLLAGFGGGGFEATQLRSPYVASPVKVSGTSFGLIIADTHNHRIQYWPTVGSNGTGRTLLGGPGFGAPSYEGPTELEFPTGLVIDEVNGYLYVSDTGRHRVRRYVLDVEEMQILGVGLTVAGTDFTSGSNESLLDNPTSLALQGDRLYVADARNSRVMTWLVRPELLALDMPRRLSSIDETNSTDNMTGNTTGTQTTVTTSSFTWTTSVTRSTTTTTTYQGPRYFVELDGLVGRPYGIYASADGIYVSDADGCTIWKKTTTGETSLVVGGSCGGSLSQLYFPGGLVVEPGGAIVVADSRNNRVIRFGANPTPSTLKCTLGGFCEVALRNGLPTSRNRLTLIRANTRSVCGAACTRSGLGAGTWVNSPSPQPPLLNVARFVFGVAGTGDTMRDYTMCFGSEGIEDEISAGNCTSVPYNVGTVRMLPYLYAGDNTECVSNTPCTVNLDGYGIPDTAVIAAVLDSAYGSGTQCGTGSTQNFQGYRSFFLNNPGTVLAIEEPYISQGNRSAIVRLFFGEAISYGSQLLCVCYEGNDCVTPSRFKEPVGYLRVRSAVSTQNFCRFGQTCVLNISGQYLRDTDTAVLTPVSLASCTSLSFQVAEQFSFDWPAANASSASSSLLEVADGLNFVLFDLGVARDNGIFKVCYCASYEGEDADTFPCSTPAEFTQDAGTLVIMRVDPQDYECSMNRNCSIEVRGLFMAATDVLLETGGLFDCGTVVPQEADVVGGVAFQQNFFTAQVNATGDPNASQLFALISFTAPGQRQLCYCSTYDGDPSALNDQIRGPCNDAMEFTQPLGILTLRGPSASVLSCAANVPCNITVTGVRLASDDVLQVCSTDSGCGNSTLCAAVGPEAQAGLLSPLSASSTATTFGLGSLPIGSYLLCYCAPGTGGTAPQSCASPEDLDTSAGQLRVRGVTGGAIFECVENLLCQFQVQGFDLRSSDMVWAIPLDGQCGVTESNFQINAFNPSSRTRATANTGSSSARDFEFDSITVPERYKICYCVFPSCVNASHFSEEVGVLVVKGIERSRYALACALGERCHVSFNGSGFEISTDSLKLIPSGMPCGGDLLRLTGDGSNDTQQLLGLYEKGPFVYNGRLFYQQRGGRFMIFYNIFRGWWVIQTDLDTQEPPYAWADGRAYTTPNQLPEDAWQIWIIDDVTVIGAGFWYSHPTLRAAATVDAGFAFSMNPSTVMTRIAVDDALGLPYLSSVTFDVGLASTAGTYKLCWCPSWDWPESSTLHGGDVDTVPCSSEQEFFVNNGNLVVGFLTAQDRYHCMLGANCLLGVALPASLPNQRAVLLPGNIRCAEAQNSMASPWSDARNVSGSKPLASTNWTVFDFGSATVVGEFQICICTNYDNGQDGLACSQIEEFYEAAGPLIVADEVFLAFEAGLTPVDLNVSRGYGLDSSDRLFLHSGFFCNASTLGSFVISPSTVEAAGAWALYSLDSLQLPSGLYVACLCSNFDGPDADQVRCNDADEFTAPVGRLQVAAVEGPQLSSSVSGTITLRLNLTRRLSAVHLAAASSGYALATALEIALRTVLESYIVPVSVVITGVSPLLGSNPLDVSANFTATFNGSAEEHLLEVRDFDNASCPEQLLDPPWSTTGGAVVTPAFEDSALLLGCLRLADILTNEGPAIQSAVTLLLQSASLSGIGAIEVMGIESLKAPAMGYLPAVYRCVRGAPCRILVEAALGSGLVPADGSMLLTGSSVCGSQDLQRLTTVLPSNPVDASSPGSTSTRLVDLGAPLLEGSYTLCYCAGGDSGSGTCGSSLDYFSLVGTLSVRGPNPLEAFCVVYKDCNVSLWGVELSVWDSLLVKDGTGSCYDSTATGFGASSYFAVNPAGLPTEDSLARWTFQLGVASQTGTYQICYCASYSAGSTVPCQSPSEFTMQAGFLYVRGVQQTNSATFSCVRSSKGDADAACDLPVEGTALMPVQDKMLVVPASSNASCGEVQPEVSFGVSPNPVALSIADNVNATPWGLMSSYHLARWVITRLEIVGSYQICYCADSADGLQDGRGACFTSVAGFYHEVGTLEVRGADSSQMFLCVPGEVCELLVSGVNLSTSDKVRLVGPEDSCARVKSSINATTVDFNAAVEANATHARFNLGTILSLDNPSAMRLCYCANFNQDGQGETCSDANDFTHSAGVVNMAICPQPPSSPVFVVPVQDVYGGIGEGMFRLYSLPAWVCIDTPSRTPADYQRYQSILPLGTGGSEGKGGDVGGHDLVFSSGRAQCVPGIDVNVPRLPNMNDSATEVSVVGGSGARTDGLLIEYGFRLQVASSLSDERGNLQSCSTWEVEMRSFGCGWDAALTFGFLLHLFIGFIILWTCFSNQLYHCSAFCSWTKKVDPIVDSQNPLPLEDTPLRRAADAGTVQPVPTTKTGGTFTVKAFAAGGASVDEPDRPLQILCSSRAAWLLVLVRMTTLIVQLVVVLLRVEDAVIFFLIPALMALVCLVAQVVLVWTAWGRYRTWRCFKRPQHLMHSFTLNLKLHVDMVIPLLARRHHAELWRVAVVLVILELLVQVLHPIWTLLLVLRSARRTLRRPATAWSPHPRPAAPQRLEQMEVDVNDERVQTVLKETMPKPDRHGSLSTTDPMTVMADVANKLTLDKLPKGVTVQQGKIGLEGIATTGAITTVKVTGHTSAVGEETEEPRERRSRRTSVEFLAGGLALEDERSPSTTTQRYGARGARASADLYASFEEERSPAKGSLTNSLESRQKHEELVLHMFRMKALEEHLKESRKPRWRCRCCSFCLSVMMSPFRCCAARYKGVHQTAAFWRSPHEGEAPEEFRRRRIVGLWGFLDSTGWYVAALQFRRHAEGAGGFQLPHFEDRRAFISNVVGGFDLAVICSAMVGMYLPRLNYTELFFLIFASFVTILQVARPGIFQAASALADDTFLNPQSLACFFFSAVLLRCLTIAVLGFGCASFSWWGYFIWTSSVLVLEGPVLLFCWRSWPVIWSIVTGHKAPWPSHISSMFTDFAEIFLPPSFKDRNQGLTWRFKNRTGAGHGPPSPPQVSRAPGAARKLDLEQRPPPPNLREAAYAVLQYRKEQGAEPAELQWLPAEPCLAALVQLVEDIVYGVPQDLSQIILDNHGEVAQLHQVFGDLNRQPPHLEDKKRRVRRLAEAKDLVDRLSPLCQYMGPMTRQSYDTMHAQVLEELWLARSMVRMDSLLRTQHFRRGCLSSRARLLEAQLPTAPRWRLVHHQTLERLGRLPSARDFEHLTLAREAHEAHGRHAVVMVAVHRWRSLAKVDPHGVTWRQLVTFARWYRWRWGNEHQVFFWIDSCCVPEIRGKLPEKPKKRPDLWADDERDDQEFFQQDLPPTSPDSKGAQPSFAQWTVRRGLTNLTAWSKAAGDNLDTEDYVSEEEDQPYVDLVANRSADADLPGLDAFFPALFAAADGVVLCNSHDFERDAWCRLYLSLAYSFLPCGRLIYEVKRDLVHITRAARAQRRASQQNVVNEAVAPDAPDLPGSMQLVEAGDGEDNGPTSNETPEQSKPTSAEQPQETNAVRETTPPMAQSSPGEESCQSQLNEEELERKGTFEDLDFLEDCLEGFLDDAQALSYEKLLPVPTDWDNVLVEQEMDMGRIQRLTSVCMDTPSLPTDTGYRRLPLVYGERKALVCSLAGPKRNARSKVKTTQEEESSSESELEAEETSEASDQELPLVPYTEVIEETEEDQMLQLYLNRPEKEAEATKSLSLGTTLNSFFKAKSAPARSLQPPPTKLTMMSAPPVLRFHETFISRAVKTDIRRRVAERICETTTFLRTSSVGSGGLALVSKPLEVRDNVCPDAPNAYGVTFDVVVEEVDAQKHRDGLAIGFTAEAPDTWPYHRKAIPQTALEMPRSCLVGYSGRWVAPGQRELVQGAYNPAALKRGDVLTAVIAGAPASLMRILVNGKVVAQKPLSFTGLDPAKPLWGLIDIEGSCVKVRLGASLLN